MTESLRTQILLKNIYQEATPSKLRVHNAQLLEDSTYMDEYLELLKGYNSLPVVELSPSQSSLDFILSQSRQDPVAA